MSGPQLKTGNQIMAYLWTFRKDPKIREDFVSDPQLNMI